VRKFSAAELAKFNGEGGAPAYVAFEGKVYDVTQSPTFEGGSHEELHQAGADLTEAMLDAPHGAEVLEGYPVVGELGEG